ncbi:UcrQ domain containing protein [Aphelenchoides fujianensis]|nr:UcrQ domain containing protein [Aphelenchoides fujianensis]
MRVSPVLLHKHFGNLGKVYGQYRFGLAPNEQKPFKGFFDQAVVRVLREYVWKDWIYYVPPAVASFLVYDWAKKENYKINRKNPADYANDT